MILNFTSKDGGYATKGSDTYRAFSQFRRGDGRYPVSGSTGMHPLRTQGSTLFRKIWWTVQCSGFAREKARRVTTTFSCSDFSVMSPCILCARGDFASIWMRSTAPSTAGQACPISPRYNNTIFF